MVYVGDYEIVKRRCKNKIEELTSELEASLKTMGYAKKYTEQASQLFEEEIEDLLEGIIDQIEAHIIGVCQANIPKDSDATNNMLNVNGRSLNTGRVYYYGLTPTTQREIGEEKKIVLGKEEAPSK